MHRIFKKCRHICSRNSRRKFFRDNFWARRAWKAAIDVSLKISNGKVGIAMHRCNHLFKTTNKSDANRFVLRWLSKEIQGLPKVNPFSFISKINQIFAKPRNKFYQFHQFYQFIQVKQNLKLLTQGERVILQGDCNIYFKMERWVL